MTLWELAGLLALGSVTGFLAGLFGIGGGGFMVPFMTLLLTAQKFPPDHVVHMAIATSLATILFTSASSVRAHHQRGAVLWPVARVLAPGILVGACSERRSPRPCPRRGWRCCSPGSSASRPRRCC
jgi:uncharacterized protein